MPYIDSIRLLATKVLPAINDCKMPVQAMLLPYVNTRVLVFDTHTHTHKINQPTNQTIWSEKKLTG